MNTRVAAPRPRCPARWPVDEIASPGWKGILTGGKTDCCTRRAA